MANSRTLNLILLLFYCGFVVSGKVPVFIWSNDDNEHLPSSLAGQFIEKDEFRTKYLPNMANGNEHNIAVFLQDRLSLDDISKYADVYNTNSDGDVFRNLKNIMEDHPSTHLPAVVSPSEALLGLQDHFDGDVVRVKGSSEAKLDLSDDERHLLIVDLPQTADSDDGFRQSLQQNDEIIGSLTEQLKSSGKRFISIYTGLKSSDDSRSTAYTGRHLLAADTDATLNYTFINSTCMYFYAERISLFSGDTSFIMKPIDQADVECGNNTVDLTMTFSLENSTAGNVTMRMTFMNRGYSWNFTSFSMDYQLPNGTGESISATGKPMPTRFITDTPRNFSYHCFDGKKIMDVNRTISVQFRDLQVQPFKRKGEKFGYYNDCVGFFSIPIWSGIITVLVLLAILAFGIVMLANITTMDRFDDPKGKTITVNVME